MDFTRLSLSTLIPQIPKIVNDNFDAMNNYMNIFYDSSVGIIIKPITTSGSVKGTTGEFVNVVVDNLTVKKQFTNWYENYTTVDKEWVDTWNGGDVSTRIPSSYASLSDASIWPIEASTYEWKNVIKPYYKLGNDVSYGFQNNVVGQEFQIMFNHDVSTGQQYRILMEASIGGILNLYVNYQDASTTYVKLITTSFDASYGPTWTVKSYQGNYTIQ